MIDKTKKEVFVRITFLVRTGDKITNVHGVFQNKIHNLLKINLVGKNLTLPTEYKT